MKVIANKMIDKINYETRLTAFIDILGFKDIIFQSKNSHKQEKFIFKTLNSFKEDINTKNIKLFYIKVEECVNSYNIEKFNIKKRANFSYFSDSVIISVKCDDTNLNESISTLIMHISKIGAKLLKQGILLRGGLTYGELIHLKNGIVFGKALIEAHEIESKYANYPRIILSDALIKKLNFPIHHKYDRFPYHQYLKRFDDGCVGFHQMIFFEVCQSIITVTKDYLSRCLAKVRKKIVEGLDSTFVRSDIHAKYRWLKKEYNELCILNANKEPIFNNINKRYNIHFSNNNNKN